MNSGRKILVFISLFRAIYCNFQIAAIIEYEQGSLIGKYDQARNGKPFVSFQGIPYARPPIAGLRFKAPQPLKSWGGVLNGSKEGPTCPQQRFGQFIGEEDCLYLNVYTPSLKNDRLPVMFWIHGGQYTEGSGNSDLYGPKNLLTQDIILVTVNYRLGVLGFLSLEDTTLNVPGNAGIKDILVALDWVQKYISYFGGDPEKVTIAGQSVGGVLADLIVLSDKAKGKFRGAILQSGNAGSLWATLRKFQYRLAETINMTVKTENEIFDKLKDMPLLEILEAQAKMCSATSNPVIGPVIEPANLPNSIITKRPDEMLRSGNFAKIPFFMGFDDREGIFHYGLVKANSERLPKMILDSKKGVLKKTNITEEQADTLFDKIELFYYGDEEPSVNNLERYFDMVTDIGFMEPIVTEAKILQKLEVETYFYVFGMDTELNLCKREQNTTKLFKGAAHSDENGYLFNYKSSPVIVPDSKLDTYVKTVVELWTNFVKFGNPNNLDKSNKTVLKTVWKPVTKENFNYLKISRDLEQDVDPFKERYEFWTNLYAEAKNAANFINCNLILMALIAMAHILNKIIA